MKGSGKGLTISYFTMLVIWYQTSRVRYETFHAILVKICKKSMGYNFVESSSLNYYYETRFIIVINHAHRFFH